MVKINENYFNLQDSYLFSTIREKVEVYEKNNPKETVINLGIGDVTLPLIPEVVNAMKKAVDEMSEISTFKGYGPEQGYEFLREKIVENEYLSRKINISKDEIFVSDGSKCDMAHIIEIFDKDNKIAIQDPVYPVYVDSNVMLGRSGEYVKETGKYKNIVYMPCVEENNFIAEIPNERVDIIYLCFPNNPTGATLTKENLKKWVDYAIENDAIILFDAAYEAFISQKRIPHSIYEIEGAKKVAIEFKSFSKTAGFTGVRLAYTVIPKELKFKNKEGKSVNINSLWKRHQSTTFNGASYISQKGAEAIYSKIGRKQIAKNIKYYKNNAKIMRETLTKLGFKVFGGINSPYVWLKLPEGKKSWEFFDELLNNLGVVGTPGVGFGKSGEGCFRLSSFGKKEDVLEAMKRMEKYFKRK